MKILAIGDPHGKIPKLGKIKDIDLILIPGDIGKANMIRKFAFDEELRKKAAEQGKSYLELLDKKTVKKTFEEMIYSSKKVFKRLSKIAPVYWIHGNVELGLDEDMKRYKLGIPLLKDISNIKNVHLINSTVIKVKGIKIAGQGYYHKISLFERLFSGINKEIIEAFKIEHNKAKKFLKDIGHVDILLTHDPPYKILDKVSNPNAPKRYQGINAGNKIIRKYCLKYKPRYVLFGHIHEAKGKLIRDGTIYINLGYNGDYKIIEI